MKYKKIIAFVFLAVCFLSIAGVCASDAGDMDVQTSNDTSNEVIASEEIDNQDNNDAISSNEDNGENMTSDDLGNSFYYLQSYVDYYGDGDELNLTSDFSMLSGGTTVKISKNITINGNGHTLNGNNLNSIFSIAEDGKQITFKNIKFKNGGAEEFQYTNDRGGAILNLHPNTFIMIINCEFSHNGAHLYGGAIYSDGDLTIHDSKFYKNVAESGNGGAIFCHGNMFINNTEFSDNQVQKKSGTLSGVSKVYDETYVLKGEHQIESDDYEKTIKSLEDEIRDLTDATKEYLKGKMNYPDLETHFAHYGYYLPFDSPYEGRIYAESIIKNLNKKLEEYKTSTQAPMSGGAIYCEKQCAVYNSIFKNNVVGTTNTEMSTCGGAIHCRNFLHVHNSTFDDNSVNDWGGGAVFCEKKCEIYDSRFEDNTANKGCAVYCWGETNIYNSEFSYNTHIEDSTWLENQQPISKLLKALTDWIPGFSKVIDQLDTQLKVFFPSEGGAVWSGGACHIESCMFDNNHAMEFGGAIYSKGDLTITGKNNIFHHNKVNRDSFGGFYKEGGAIYCEANLLINNSNFYINYARTDGGAIFCEKECNIYNSKFDRNVAKESGLTRLINCYGGAIDTDKVGTISNCTFIHNTAGNSKVTYDGGIPKGGAIYVKNECNAKIISCSFQENSADFAGGAIYLESENAHLNVSSCEFNDNHVIFAGGAIYCKGESYIYGCNFDNHHASKYFEINSVKYLGSGGAIYSETRITLEYCNFTRNHAYENGGAIHAGKITMNHVLFSGNNLDNDAGKNGGALFSNDVAYISYCNFTGNTAKSGGAMFTVSETKIFNSYFAANTADNGGAIYTDIKLNALSPSPQVLSNGVDDVLGDPIYDTPHLRVYNSVFNNHQVQGEGGAIYASCEIKMSNSSFTDNTAKSGGALYAVMITEDFDSSSFIRNKATSGSGGAIYVRDKCSPQLSNCYFEENSASDKGGALFTKDWWGYLKLSSSTFVNNSAKSGGAVYTYLISTVSGSSFLKNKATANDGDGGAIYIDNKCDPEFISCRFEENTAQNIGGAIYTKKEGTGLKVSYCSFIGNHADKKSYHGPFYHGAGHSIFNTGHFVSGFEAIMCWFGTNNPDFNDQIVVYKRGGSDSVITPKNHLKIDMKINETTLYENNPYKTTVYFYSSDGSNLNKDILHSTGKFYGNGTFSNIKADINDMTADVKFDTLGTSRIYGKLDNQEVFLDVNVIQKEPCVVRIISCEDVKYPDVVKVTYEISPLSDKAYLVVKDNNGEIVKQVNITSQLSEELVLRDLLPGNYSLTIINPETWKHLAGSANTTFNVMRGDVNLLIVVTNETYPENVECDIRTSVSRGYMYNLTITADSGEVISKMIGITNRKCHVDLGTLDAGNYTATIYFPGYDLYNPTSNSTRFEVAPTGTGFEIDVNPSEIYYGETATVIPIFNETVSGTIRYYLDNGTFLGELPFNENLTLPVWNSGAYIIIANYTGDRNHKSALDTTYLIINQAKTAFELEANPVTYGENATVTNTLPKAATGNITYYLINGTFLAELPGNESLALPVLDAGSYVIIANYPGDRNFLNATANTTLIVNKAKAEFKIDILPIIYGINATVSHTLQNDATGTIRYYLSDGTFLGEAPVGVNMILPVFDAGSYVIIANYTGDGNYLNATANATLNVSKAETEITANPVTVMYNSNGNLLVVLTDFRGNPIYGVNVTVDLRGVKNYTTNEYGLVLISTNNLGVNTYDVAISFNGNNNYLNCSKATKVTVSKMIDTMTTTPLVTIYQVHKYLVINLKDELEKPIANEYAFIKINGVTYKCKTDAKGNARLIIRLDAKTYKAKVTFNNPNYASATAYVKVTVLKAKPKITAKKKTFKAKKIIKRYTVKLTVHGKALAKVKVTLKINGKTYKAKTNAKGKATFKIKKLAQKGKYIAVIKYKGNYLYKKATKKVKIVIK